MEDSPIIMHRKGLGRVPIWLTRMFFRRLTTLATRMNLSRPSAKMGSSSQQFSM